jgi:hypothetical protein
MQGHGKGVVGSGVGLGSILKSLALVLARERATMMTSWSNVPAVEGMWGPGSALGGFFMDEDANARRGNGRAVEVEVAKKLSPSGEFRIQAGATEKIESEEGLGEETIPQMEGEVLINAAQAGDEVIFERTDGAFSSIASVHARRGELEVDLFVTQELFEGGGTFVVEALELGAKAGGAEALVEGFVASKDGGGSAAGDGLRQDAIAVVVVEDNHIIIAVARRSNESTRLVGVDLTGGFQEGSEARVRAEIRRVTGGKGNIRWGGGRNWGSHRKGRAGGVGFGGALILAALVQMPCDHMDRSRGILV